MQGFGVERSGVGVNSDRLVAVSSMADASFVDFYLAEHDGQVRRAYLMLNDAEAAHDVVASAFVVLYQRWDRIEQPGPYLNRCVLNGCRDRGRGASRELTTAQSIDGRGEVDRIDELGELLADLPFKQRAAIVLRFYAGWSERDIAGYLGCRPGTVGSLIHRGLAALRCVLKAEGGRDGRE